MARKVSLGQETNTVSTMMSLVLYLEQGFL